jgi:hypothetical protein
VHGDAQGVPRAYLELCPLTSGLGCSFNVKTWAKQGFERKGSFYGTGRFY